MNNQGINEELIDNRANVLAVFLSKIPIWDIKKIQEMIALHIKDILSDYIAPDRGTLKSKLEKRKQELDQKCNIFKQVLSTPGASKEKRIVAEKRISLLKPEMKKVNVALNSFRDEEEYVLLKKFILEKYGESVLKEFYETILKKHEPAK